MVPLKSVWKKQSCHILKKKKKKVVTVVNSADTVSAECPSSSCVHRTCPLQKQWHRK